MLPEVSSSSRHQPLAIEGLPASAPAAPPVHPAVPPAAVPAEADDRHAKRKSAADATAMIQAALVARAVEKKDGKATRATDDKGTPGGNEPEQSKAGSKRGKPKSKAKSKSSQVKPKAKAKAKAASGSSIKPKAKAKAASGANKQGSWCYERSRNQILARTGLSGPGTTKTFSGMGPASKKAAEQWLREQA